MDLSEFAELLAKEGDELKEAIKTLKVDEPDWHDAYKRINGIGYKAGFARATEESRTASDADIKAIKAERDALAEEKAALEEQMAKLSEEKPDVAKIVAEKDLTIKNLQQARKDDEKKHAEREKELLGHLTEKDRSIFEGDYERALRRLNLKEREVLMALATTGPRFVFDEKANQWKVYEKDGKALLALDEDQLPHEALAESYAKDLPKEAFVDLRARGPSFEDNGTIGGSKSMKASIFEALPAGERTALGGEIRSGELKIIDG